MKVILNKDLENLGEEGDVCEVARGYARNFLIPRNLAMPYNKQTINLLERRRDEIEQRKEEKRKQAMGLKERLEEEVLSLKMPAGSSGKLFGSVTNATISEALEKRGINLPRKRIEVPDNTIKSVGNYTVRIKLYESEEANLQVSVEPEGGEAKKAAEAEEKPARSKKEKKEQPAKTEEQSEEAVLEISTEEPTAESEEEQSAEE